MTPTHKTYYYRPQEKYFVFTHPEEFVKELKESKLGWNDAKTSFEYIQDYGDRLEKLYGFKIDSSSLVSFVDSLIKVNLLVQIDHEAHPSSYP